MHFLYSGSAYAPTGISSYMKSFINHKGISVYTTDSGPPKPAQSKGIPTRKRIISSIRLALWKLAERYYFFFCLYRKLIHERNATTVCRKFFEGLCDESDIVVINDIWTLLEYQRRGSLGQAYFVFHCNGDLFNVSTVTFPSCNNKKFKRVIDNVYEMLEEVRGVIFLTQSALNIYKMRQQSNQNCFVINNGFGEKVKVTNEEISKRFNIFCTGTICRRKRQYLLPKLDLTSLINMESVILYGGGPEKAQLVKELTGKKNGLFCFKGEVDRPFEAYKHGDVFVLLSSDEGMPVAAIEALSRGCIIIMTDVGGARELICNNGLLVSNQTEKQIVDDVNEFMRLLDSDSERRKKMANESLDIFNKKFTTQRMVSEYLSLP